MARPARPLEEQLQNAQDELERLLNKETETRQKIEDIKAAIEDRDMRDSYASLKEYGISVDELKALLAKEAEKKAKKKEKEIA